MASRNHPLDTLLKHLFLILSVIVLCVFAVLAIWGDSGLKELWLLKNQKTQLSEKNLQILNENWLYLGEVNRLNNPRFLEQRARSEMGLIRKNETVYVIEE